MDRSCSDCFVAIKRVVRFSSLSLIFAASPSLAGDTNSFVTFSGNDWAKDSHYVYQGVAVALNRDLSKDGFLVRLFGGIADYSYLSNAQTIDGKGYQADALIGYQHVEGEVNASFYVGFDYQDQKLSPKDPTNEVSGVDTGLKVLGEISSPEDNPLQVSFTAAYSTAFETYWNRLSVSVDFGHFKAGPEGVIFGNEGFSAKRLGAFASFDVKIIPALPFSAYVNIGRQIVDDEGGASTAGGTGTYAGFGFSSAF